MKNFQKTVDNVADGYMRHYCAIGVVAGVVLFIVLTIAKPDMWLIWLLFSAFIGWANGLVGYAILGVVYIVIFALYPFVRMVMTKESAKRLYSGIDGKEVIKSIVWFYMTLFPVIWMVCVQ